NVLSASRALGLLVGMADSGIAVGPAVDAMVQAGQIALVDLSTLASAAVGGTAPPGAVTFVLASAYAPFVGNATATGLIAQLIDGLIQQAAFTTTVAGQAIAGFGIDLPNGAAVSTLIGDTVTGPGIGSGVHVIGLLGSSVVVLDQQIQSASGTYVFLAPPAVA